MKANKYVKKCGPYEVTSISQDGQGIRIELYPAFPEYNITEKRRAQSDVDGSWKKETKWALHRYKGEGGGPGIFSVIALAKEIEAFLNQSYSEKEIADWKELNAKALAKVRADINKRFEKAMAKQEREAKK